MFILIFVVSEEDVVVPSVDTTSKRVSCMSECSPIVNLRNVARNILRLQDFWSWL